MTATAFTIDHTTFTPQQWDRIDAVARAVERTPHGATRSALARTTRQTPEDVEHALAYLVDAFHAHTTGNGAWTRWHDGPDPRWQAILDARLAASASA